MYKPLPKEVTIKESSIEGLGIFATENIKEGHVFGVSHVLDYRFEDDYIRTPLGGFVNHSEEPNCKLMKKVDEVELVTTKDITSGAELTTKYSLYRIEKENEN